MSLYNILSEKVLKKRSKFQVLSDLSFLIHMPPAPPHTHIQYSSRAAREWTQGSTTLKFNSNLVTKRLQSGLNL